jgi:glycosyltransferase involved in cell wall biosynthesis
VRILVVSGMWPPDVGGPASHAPEFAGYLHERGHAVEAITMADREPAAEPYPVHWASRRLPIGPRHVQAVELIRRHARRAEVVYSTGMVGRSSLGAALARRPILMKLTSDPVFERSIRFNFWASDLDTFQRADGLGIRLLRLARDAELRHVTRIVIPSEALRRLAIGWGLPPEKVTLVRNPVPPPPELAPRDELRQKHGFDGPTLAFAGRLVPQKSIDVALEAVKLLPWLSLVLAGDGPFRERLHAHRDRLGLQERARFLGPQSRQTVFELLKAADGALLSSSWENFPHMLVEALAVGTPVIATDTGGVNEIVRDEWNGLLVPPGDPQALAATIERYFEDDALRERLAHESVDSVARFDPAAIYAELEQLLERTAAEAT